MGAIRFRDHYILDVLEEGAEYVSDMLTMLNGPDEQRPCSRIGHEDVFTREEVIAALSRLVQDNSLRVIVSGEKGEMVELDERKLPNGSYEDVWFDVTPRGSVRWANWYLDEDRD